MDSNSLLNLSPSQLRRAAELKERIDSLNAELAQLLGGEDPISSAGALGGQAGNGRRGRKMSAAGRARIAAAARARWARERAGKGGSVAAGASGNGKPKRKMSAAARKKIAAAQKARWARVKAAKAT